MFVRSLVPISHVRRTNWKSGRFFPATFFDSHLTPQQDPRMDIAAPGSSNPNPRCSTRTCHDLPISRTCNFQVGTKNFWWLKGTLDANPIYIQWLTFRTSWPLQDAQRSKTFRKRWMMLDGGGEKAKSLETKTNLVPAANMLSLGLRSKAKKLAWQWTSLSLHLCTQLCHSP